MAHQKFNKIFLLVIFSISYLFVFSQNKLEDLLKKTNGVSQLPELKIILNSGNKEEGSKISFKAISKNFNSSLSYTWEYKVNGKIILNSSSNIFTINKVNVGKNEIYLFADDGKKNKKADPYIFNVKPKPIIPDVSKINELPRNKSPKTETTIEKYIDAKINGPNYVDDIDRPILLTASVLSNYGNITWKWNQSIGDKLDYSINSLNDLVINKPKVGTYEFGLSIVENGVVLKYLKHSMVIENKILPTVSVNLKDIKLTLPENSCTIDAKGNSAVVAYFWDQISGPSLNYFPTTNTNKLNLQNLQSGNYTFKVTVKDKIGNIASESISIVVNDKPVVYVSPNSQLENKFPKQKGGPSNAILNLLLPGLGHYYVSGDYLGQNRRAKSFAITLVYLGAVGASYYYKNQSDIEYAKYLNLANYREYQRDAAGNIIGQRGLSSTSADQNYSLANEYKNMSNNFLIGAGTILVSDFIYTIIKGSKNSKQYKSNFNLNSFRISGSKTSSEITASFMF